MRKLRHLLSREQWVEPSSPSDAVCLAYPGSYGEASASLGYHFVLGLGRTPSTARAQRTFAPSLVPLMKGRSKNGPNEFAITASFLRGDRGTAPGTPNTPALYTKKWAYVPFGPTGRKELFDISRDEYCTKNVITDFPAIAARLHRKLVKWLKDMDAPAEALLPFE